MTTNNAVNTSLAGQTGTGNFVGATSPTLITPALGTPASGVLSSCSGYPFSSLTGSIAASQMIALGNSAISAIGTFSKNIADASTTQTISGLSFQPSLVLFIGSVSAAVTSSWGFDNGTNFGSISYITTGTFINSSSFSIIFEASAGNLTTGKITSFSSGGFTITWTKTGSPTGTANIQYLAFQ